MKFYYASLKPAPNLVNGDIVYFKEDNEFYIGVITKKTPHSGTTAFLIHQGTYSKSMSWDTQRFLDPNLPILVVSDLFKSILIKAFTLK